MVPDLLHQIIKGTFKDHLVEWVGEYLVSEYGKTRAATIMANIDHQWILFTWLDFINIPINKTLQHCSCPLIPWTTPISSRSWIQTVDRRWLQSAYEGMYDVIQFHYSLNQSWDLSTRYCWPCSPTDGPGIKHLYGFLLSSPVKCTWWINPGCHWCGCNKVPCISCWRPQ